MQHITNKKYRLTREKLSKIITQASKYILEDFIKASETNDSLAYIDRKTVQRILGGVTSQTLWLWDKKGILKPHHTQNKKHFYKTDDIIALRLKEFVFRSL